VLISGVEDPLGYDVPLSLKSRYYPMGCPVEISTNSPEIIAAADEIWGQFPVTRNEKPARLTITVEDQDASAPLQAAMPRGRSHLVSIVHGTDNFVVCDLAGSFAFGCLTRDVARDREYLRYHFLEPAVYLMIDAAHLSPVHASCVALEGRAVLLCGDAGAGKTSLAYACARRGWTYLSDDATHLVRGRSDRAVVGRPFRIRFRESARLLFPELNRFMPARRPNGKLDIEVETSALNLQVALESTAACIVFLKRGGAGAAIEPCGRMEAARRLQTLTCYGDERIRAAQSRTLMEFLELPVVELTYGDLDAAEKALRTLVASGA
jgi:hypothetical protein